MRCEELPEYTVRVSQRAKRVILKVSGDRGLEVVVPLGFDQKRVPEVVSRRRAWIERQFEKLVPAGPPELPGEVGFAVTGEVFAIDVVVRPGPPRLKTNSDGRVMLAAPGAAEGLPLLRAWLKQRAGRALPPMLRRESRRTGFDYKRAQVRLQRSRWASCSTRGTVSLNARLMFLPPELVRYVLVHELCHVGQMNHSGGFWRLVEKYAPDYRLLEKRLKEEAGEMVPRWAL
jgi:hypothetical protein